VKTIAISVIAAVAVIAVLNRTSFGPKVLGK
jgi:hypothetical protein